MLLLRKSFPAVAVVRGKLLRVDVEAVEKIVKPQLGRANDRSDLHEYDHNPLLCGVYQHALDARLLDPVKGQILLRKVVLGNDAQKILARQVFQIVLIIGKNRKGFRRSDLRRILAKLLLVRDRKFLIEFIANPYVRSRIMIMNIFKRR